MNRQSSLSNTSESTDLTFMLRLTTEFGDQIEVPALHVLFSSSEQDNTTVQTDGLSSTPRLDDVPQIRELLIDWIAEEALCGDREAAEWVLLASIARA